MERIYLDYAATTPTHPEVVKAMEPYFTKKFGNPSSLYSFGQEARAAVQEARQKVATFIGAKPEEIVFTSGGSESNNFALKGVAFALKNKGTRIITSAIEHHAVSEPCKFLARQGFEIVTLPVDKDGLVNPDEVRKAINDRTILVTIMHANNEIGTIQPIKEIGKICREKGVLFHTDAVQTTGHVAISVTELNVDLLSSSGHKFYGPKGVGFLYIRKGTKILPFIQGGDQERRFRAGTENTPGIIGLEKAIEIAESEMAEEASRLIPLRDRLIQILSETIPDCRLNGHPTRRLPNNVNLSFAYVEGESMLLNLDLEGIAVSTGSACTSSSLEPSSVLLAIGLPPETAHGSIRFTSGKWTTSEEVDRVLEVFPKIVAKLRLMSPLYPGGKK
ncbi:MAG: cysteine desulfurase NifS [bacterium (Candidatus Ratteibacteria) CG23_combo_of_CG06-09_8_20_14_all_48_7]|uniref:Cysteine desulfurase IscS n=1 Tax=bacterium (Candidatus Ratteibacteria) CG23_combo_of_CG06-09_8_20_14_all_48_7 TaxID=2014292 RepID=A0A2G9YC68_9BACT|nr:MAG: cysteine desulfurase NifS [bacterium (Candidatus Ratteibacteria) CG23_combo_of_CG06-09_8_20_14_all_48_7]